MVVNPDYQQLLFENTIQACRESDSVQHVVVMESPRTSQETCREHVPTARRVQRSLYVH